jgi:FAD/FMN-containing dehydrogenase/Fe-S oxidoreductase
MLPRLDPQQLIEPLYLAYTEQLAASPFTGDINTQYSARLAVATDNSVYQQLPQLVLHPRSIQDVQLIMQLANEPKFQDIKFSARGGGTGTNGQSLTPGIVVDLSKYMNKILVINVEERWVEVEAGVVKDQLNDYLRPYGFFFSPDLSTSNRATIGGMINTDASGQGSLVYGKTSDHVLALCSVLANGERLDTSAISVEQAKQRAEQSTVEGNIYRQIIASAIGKRALILEKFPRLNRFLTGYDLEHVYDEEQQQINLSRVITGSEGSLAIVCRARLNITRIPKSKVLVNIKYNNFESALRHSPTLVAAKATSVETVDSKVLNLARQDIIWHSVSDLITDVPNKVMEGLNIVEFNGDNEQEVDDKVSALTAQLDQDIQNNTGVIGYQVTNDNASINKIYAMRKKSVGLLGNTQGSAKPIAFVEDTAVPPENLADYILEFRALLDSYQLDYGMFGHVDAGVLHVRPALDLCDPQQEIIFREISDQVVALTAKYGGLMWGEHGKGYRSEYSPAFFGEELYTELRYLKAAFDPLNKMNPGKICTPYNSDESLVSVDATKRGFYDRQIPIKTREALPAVLNCNGNGLCFNYDVNSPMCPSSKVTRDRRHSPKGRAGLMREWLRLLAAKGVDFEQLEQAAGQWSVKQLLDKVKNKLTKSPQPDFSDEVMEAMAGCLACKACASQCPVKVDVPEFRARFMQVYYSRYFRPLHDHLVAHVEWITPLLAKVPNLSNQLIANKGFSVLAKKWLGYVDMPLLSTPTLTQRTQNVYTPFNLTALKKLSVEEKQKTVLVVQDPFTSFYDAEVVADFMALARRLGFNPILLPFKPNGKPQHVKGFLTKFAHTAANSAAFLNQLHQLNIPMVGLDASMVLCYRDEYTRLLGNERGQFHVLLSHEWLISKLAELPKLDCNDITQYQLFSHCTEKTALPKTESQWQQIFAHFGLSLSAVSVGCCGMAGTYGHEAKNLDNSTALFNMSWQPKLSSFTEQQCLVTGYSCRSQTKRLAKFQPKHPVQALLAVLS